MQPPHLLSTLLRYPAPLDSSKTVTVMESSAGLFDSHLASEYLLCEKETAFAVDRRESTESTESAAIPKQHEDTEEAAANRPSKKSNRLAVACLFCRKRKIKCDGQASCMHCTKKGIECVYPAIPRVRRRSSKQQPLDKEYKEYKEYMAVDAPSESTASKSAMVQIKALY